MELRLEVRPVSPFKLPTAGGMDGVARCRGGVLERLLHHEEEPVRVRVAQAAPDGILFGAVTRSAAAARWGIERMRFALGVDDDLRDFYESFANDPMIGASIRRRPWLRPRRRPRPFEALAWAVCEQLIEYERAAAIQRRIVRALGRRSACGLRDAPTPQALAQVAPARLRSFDLAESRTLTLRRVAHEVALGRADLAAEDHETTWRRLRKIAGVGPWTIEMLALHGQGRYDQVPAGDVGLLKLVGRRLSGGDPKARAEEAQVRELFAPYGRWAGLAAVHTGAI